MNWGRHYLMCPPDHFEVLYAINPWMDMDKPVDRDLAKAQWRAVRDAIEAAGAKVDVLPARPGLPDMVFTANHGVAKDGVFVPSRLRYEERRAESDHSADWMSRHGFTILRAGTETAHEGSGDCLPWNGDFIAGYGQRSDLASWEDWEDRTGWTIHKIRLVDNRFYHIDLVLCPLDSERAIIAPTGVAADDLPRLLKLVPEPLVLTPQEEVFFMMNSVVIGSTVVMPACNDRVRDILTGWGFSVVVVDVSEFIKAGGAVRCLTMPLDIGAATAAK